MAQLAGVHPATVSRALNAETAHLVAAATARKVRSAATKLGYVANPLARSLKTNRTQALGAVIPDITNPIFPPIIRGIEDAASAAGFNVLVANTDNEAARERSQVAQLRARQVDGLIVASSRVDDPVIASLITDDVPLVLVNRVEPDLPVSSVSGDDAAGIRRLVRHLIELGHTRIAHIAGPSTTATGVLRLRVFRQEVAAYGLPAEGCPVIEASAYQMDAGEQCMDQLLDSDPEITAVLAANDLLALGCYRSLRRRGLDIPGHISVAGFNDLPLVDLVQPPLTTAHIELYDLGAEAARLLLERVSGGDVRPKSVLLPVTLRQRGSTTVARTGR
ncbi:LacI family DNA-binding transcriptional regulator [Blastococcus sp. SYSU D00820]